MSLMPRGAPYLNDVRMQQVAVVDELALDVLSNFAASLHQFDGNLLTCGAVHSKLHLTIATGIDVLKYPVLGLCAKWVLVGHLSKRQELPAHVRASKRTHPPDSIALRFREKALLGP